MHLLFFLVGAALARTTHALLIGVSGYTNVPPLHANHDIAALSRGLVKSGVQEEHILILADQVVDGTPGHRVPGVPDRANLLSALDALVGRVAPDDIAFMHFSGHGVQVSDDGSDEPDGFDEALVPIDGSLDDPQTLLRDDEVSVRLEALRRRLGTKGHVLFTVDACHSGTATRGSAPGAAVRGLPRVGESARGDAARSDDAVWVEQDEEQGLASLVMLAAAQSYQRAEEVVGPDGVPMGALSRALGEAFPTMTGHADYRALEGEVRKGFRAHGLRQEPQLVGDGARVVLSGEAAWRPATVRVARSDAKQANLEGGELHGFTPGSRVVFLAPEAGAGDGPLARGTLLTATLVSATVKLDGEPAAPLTGTRAALEEVTPSARALGVAVVDAGSKQVDPALVRLGIASSALIKPAALSEADLTVELGDEVRVRGRNGLWRSLLRDATMPLDARAVVGALQVEGRRALLERSREDAPSLDFRVELGHGRRGPMGCTWVRAASPSDPLRVGVDACGVVRVTNVGPQSAHAVLFNLPPEGGMTVLKHTEEEVAISRSFEVGLKVREASVEPLALLTMTRGISYEELALWVREEPPRWSASSRGAAAPHGPDVEVSHWEYRVEPAP